MLRDLAALACGLTFGFGLALAGMTSPTKVLAFLDIAGPWDASLLFVLGGATGLCLLTFRLILRQGRPLLDESFHFSPSQVIDPPLVLGALLFGIGWGIAGYCPGPALALLAAPNGELWLFLPGMLAGILLQKIPVRK